MGDELIVDTAAWQEEARRYILGMPPHGATQNPYLLHNRILALIDALEETERHLAIEKSLNQAGV
jgi:hypothetical protein